jgi:hypothetical protein
MYCDEDLSHRLQHDPNYIETGKVLKQICDSDVPTPDSVSDWGRGTVHLCWAEPYYVTSLILEGSKPNNMNLLFSQPPEEGRVAQNIEQLRQAFQAISSLDNRNWVSSIPEEMWACLTNS